MLQFLSLFCTFYTFSLHSRNCTLLSVFFFRFRLSVFIFFIFAIVSQFFPYYLFFYLHFIEFFFLTILSVLFFYNFSLPSLVTFQRSFFCFYSYLLVNYFFSSYYISWRFLSNSTFTFYLYMDNFFIILHILSHFLLGFFNLIFSYAMTHTAFFFSLFVLF